MENKFALLDLATPPPPPTHDSSQSAPSPPPHLRNRSNGKGRGRGRGGVRSPPRWKYPSPGPTEIVTSVAVARKAIKYLGTQKIIAVDFEGVELSRDGELCIVQASSVSRIFVFDIMVMGKAVFKQGGLKALLEGRVVKVVHDCRHDCDSLLSQFGVRMVNIWDTQVAFRALRRQAELPEPLPISLKRLLGKFAGMSEEECSIKTAGKNDMREDRDFWKHRPLSTAALDYARFDVEHLLKIHATLRRYLTTENYDVVKEESEEYANMFRDDEDGPRKAQESFDEGVKKAQRDQERWNEFQEQPLRCFIFTSRVLESLRSHKIT